MSLAVPFLLAPSLPSQTDDHALPVQPTHLVSWTDPSGAQHTALTGEDNTLWVVSAEIRKGPKIPHPREESILPDLPTIRPMDSPTSPRHSRSHSRSKTGQRTPSFSHRARTISSSSLSTIGSSKRLAGAFSPPLAAHQLPTATLSSATAAAAPHDHLAHTHSPSDLSGSSGERRDSKSDLVEHLKEHQEKDRNGRNPSGLVGLGFRRGVTGVYGQAEHSEHSGSTSPKSSLSLALSNSTKETVSGSSKMFRFLRRGSDDDEAESRDLDERVQEIQVETEMEKERKDAQREKENMGRIERAIGRSPKVPGVDEGKSHAEEHGCEWGNRKVWRIVLRQVGRGKIVSLKAYLDLGVLAVLRDEGLLDLFSLDGLQSVASVDLDAPSGSPSSSKTPKLDNYWSWRSLHLARSDGKFMLFAHGLPWPCGVPSPNGELTHVIALTVDCQKKEVKAVARLELPGEGDVGVFCGSESYLLHATPTSLMSYPIIFAPDDHPSKSPPGQQARHVSAALPSRSPTPNIASSAGSVRKSRSSSNLTSDPSHHPSPDTSEKEKSIHNFLSLPNGPHWPSRKKEPEKAEEALPAAGLGEGREVERDGYGHWERMVLGEGGEGEGAGWSEYGVDVFSCDGKSMQVRGSIPVQVKAGETLDIKRVLFSPRWQQVALLGKEGKLEIYVPSADTLSGNRFKFARVLCQPDIATIYISPSSTLWTAGASSVRTTNLSSLPRAGESDMEEWKTCLKLLAPDQNLRVDKGEFSHIVPYGLEDAFVADFQGNILRRKLTSIVSPSYHSALIRSNNEEENHPCVDRLDAPVMCMKILRASSPGGERQLLAVGDEDGVVRIWTVEDFAFQGSWTLFAWPVESFAVLDKPQAGPLQNCLLAASRAGTVAVLGLDEMEPRFTIPAARSPLRAIHVSDRDILLAYANGKARVWNTTTQEFRRSTGLSAAEDMLAAGDWLEVNLHCSGKEEPISLGNMGGNVYSELGRLLTLDLRLLSKWLHSAKNNPSHSPLRALRMLLSVFLTWGINDGIDEICEEELGIGKLENGVVIGCGDESYKLAYASGADVWRASERVTGLRLLTIVALLRPFLNSPDMEPRAAEVIAFYTSSLPATIVEPDLQFFAGYYMDLSVDVQQAARMLFASRVIRLSESDVEELVELIEHDLPVHQSGTARFSSQAANALTVLGGIALQRYQSMQISVLKALSESVNLFLHDPKGLHLSLAVELCSKGFTTWQTYADPSNLLRRLFFLATNKEPPSMSPTKLALSTTVSAQARLAVLHVASSNPPLFMSTLSMDILDAKTAESRSAIMKLCVFMARKKPAVLENGLPRIAEAVVKSLDPNLGKMRDDVWQAATVILNELVLAFSTIDFHSGTQRLAVGTHEGAVIMYDLKTASRLYVLEPHKAPVSAVCFSTDGRRLLTVSLEEGLVTVWKVGSSLSGFFNVGGPPRQGGEKGEPFKKIMFRRADDQPLNSTSALSDVQITWLGARQARVTIKETALTFET
ncbi:hypothetical protein I350_04255 [Cryptococcus amylolentus CBS 6273]|uniref:Uncharacterized protein n=1 Tax=Cryptococcus amylolentus CBS 6273 TaxID=1296118 RepID=A0A1E3K1I8_9TREE|nr:hypothetical protein I350_04255 [Cryptococcus amylolentus CBS 6273]